MLAMFIPLRPYWTREVSIFLSDGECKEPYEGIEAGSNTLQMSLVVGKKGATREK